MTKKINEYTSTEQLEKASEEKSVRYFFLQ